jgi:hypothetical protein
LQEAGLAVIAVSLLCGGVVEREEEEEEEGNLGCGDMSSERFCGPVEGFGGVSV